MSPSRSRRRSGPDLVIRDMMAAPVITPEVARTLELLDALTGADRSGGVESVATTKSARRRANDPGHGIGTEVQMRRKPTPRDAALARRKIAYERLRERTERTARMVLSRAAIAIRAADMRWLIQNGYAERCEGTQLYTWTGKAWPDDRPRG